MHQREQLKSKHETQQKENKKEVSKTSQENKSLLTVPDERSYKIYHYEEKKCSNLWLTKGIYSIPKGIYRRLLNKKLIKFSMFSVKGVCKFFRGVTTKDFVHYIKPTLQDNELDTLILHILHI